MFNLLKNFLKSKTKENLYKQWHLRARCCGCWWSVPVDRDEGAAVLELAGFKKQPHGGYISLNASLNVCQGCGSRIIYNLKNEWKVDGLAWRSTWKNNFKILPARLINEDLNDFEFKED